MNHFIKWLSVPGIMALFFNFLNSIFFTLEDSPLNGLYSIVVAIWASLFVIYWKRQSRRLYIEWDNYNVGAAEQDDVRKEFKGVDRYNPVTDRIEPLFTQKERIQRYIQSYLTCAPYFLAIIFTNIVFLNLGAIIDPEKQGALF